MKDVVYIIAFFLIIIIAILMLLGVLIINVEAEEFPEIIINEIMYNPLGSDSDHEWIEMVNVSTSTSYLIDSSWRFNDGSNHQLSVIQGDNIVSPQEYLVLVDDSVVFLQDYPNYQGSLIDTVMSLNNTVDTLILSIDGGRSFFATTTYQSAWGGNDNGYSLERIDFSNSWQQSYILGGTPGQENSSAPTNSAPLVEIIGNATGTINQLMEFTASSTDPDGDELSFFWDFGDQATSSGQTVNHNYNQVGQYQVSVIVSDSQLVASSTLQVLIKEVENEEEPQEEEVNKVEYYSNQIIINEILPNPIGPDDEDEYIELLNRSSSPVDLNGWQLSDATTRRYTISSNYYSTIIPAFGYFVIYRKDSGIALNNNGDSIELYQPNGQLLDYLAYFDIAEAGWAYAKSGGSWLWTIQPTPGLPNIIKTDEEECQCNCPLQLKINESQGDFQSNQKENQELDFNSKDYQGLRINEFMPNPQGSDSLEWIELYNNSQVTLDIAGFKLDDEEGGSWPYQFPASSTISAFDFLVIDKGVSKLALNNTQDAVRLIAPDGQIFQEVNYQSVKEGWSYSYDDFNAEWFWSASSTPGAENITPPNQLEKTQFEIVAIEIEYPFYTISEIKDFDKGTKVQTVGLVTAPAGILGKNTIYISEVDLMTNQVFFSSGIQLYSSTGGFPELKVGEVIEVQGKTSQVQGEKRINLNKDSQINIINQLSIKKPELIAIDDLIDELVGGLVYVSGELVEKKGNNYYLDDGTGEIRVYLKETTNVEKPKIEEGFYMDVVGILSLTKSGYRLLPRFQEDIDAGQILGVSEEAELSNEVIVMEEDNQKRKVMNYLLFGGGGVVVILISLIVRYKYFKISNN